MRIPVTFLVSDCKKKINYKELNKYHIDYNNKSI